jgi:hypothetical protein
VKYGVNSGPPGSGMWETIRAATAPFPGWRCYATPGQGVPAVWPTPYPPRGAPPGIGFTIASIKPDIPTLLSGALDDAIRAYLVGAKPGDYWTCWHEGETNEGWTPTQIKACHKHAHALSRATRPDIRYGQIVSAYTASPYSAYHPLEQWIARGLDYHGIDGYRAQPRQTVATVFEASRHAILSVAASAHVTVCEVNSINPGRAAFLRDAYAWAVAHRCPTFFPFFFPEQTGGAYDWDPADADTISEMRTQIRAA